MASPFDKLPEEARERIREAKPPSWTDPMLATLTHDTFSDPDWIYERKLVGEVAFTEWTSDGKLRHPPIQGVAP
jgi:ATP-dependent DNA ligase